MINRNVIRQPLNSMAPALFLMLCCSIGAFAQTPSDPKESGQKERVEVSFGNSPVKTAISIMGKQLGLNIVFDDTVKEDKLTIALKDVTVEQALEIVFVAKKLRARVIEEKTILVFPDNEANRQRYSQYELWPAKSNANK